MVEAWHVEAVPQMQVAEQVCDCEPHAPVEVVQPLVRVDPCVHAGQVDR